MDRNRKWVTALIWLIGLAVVGVIVCVGMKDYMVRWIVREEIDDIATEMDTIEKEDTGEEISEASTETDAEKYYYEHSTVLGTYSVYDSTAIQTEKEAIGDFHERGFDQYEITYDYSYDGVYLGDTEATDSSEKHPIYQTYFISSTEEVWIIMLVNGLAYADPVSYNLDPDIDAQIILSESETVKGYDSANNIFYEVIPNESEIIVKIVDKIDAETLDLLAQEGIDSYGN